MFYDLLVEEHSSTRRSATLFFQSKVAVAFTLQCSMVRRDSSRSPGNDSEVPEGFLRVRYGDIGPASVTDLIFRAFCRQIPQYTLIL